MKDRPSLILALDLKNLDGGDIKRAWGMVGHIKVGPRLLLSGGPDGSPLSPTNGSVLAEAHDLPAPSKARSRCCARWASGP